MKIPELLAPAGSKESLIAAIGAGADAVYLGGARFGARSLAPNFDAGELPESVEYAHARGVRVYVTVNTLVHDGELADVARYILFLYETGVDAILVQDPAVARIAREIAPELPLHASTQMTIYDREGVAFARREGYKRVVLARELSIQEIRDIAGSPECRGIGLEIFVHGALCYSYSGQCLLSSVIGGRSGNRGMCAQPCRKPYTFVTAETDVWGRPGLLRKTDTPDAYLLSPSDLCTYRELETIAGSPVESLKIEGRMRSPRYVSAVVSVYRRALDSIGSGTWSPSAEDEERLALAFNRGFTRGYLSGARHRGIMGRSHPDHRGIQVGSVVSFSRNDHVAVVRRLSQAIPRAGDGVAFMDPVSGRKDGMVLVEDPRVRGDMLDIRVSRPVTKGNVLYLTRRAITKHSLQEAGVPVLPIPLRVSISWDQARRPVLCGGVPGKDGEMVSFSFSGEPMEIARSSPLEREQILDQLVKTGGTAFEVREIDLQYPGGLFAPVSQVNRLRRELLAHAESSITASWRPSPGMVHDARERTATCLSRLTRPGSVVPPGDVRIAMYASTPPAAIQALQGGCNRVYFEPDTPRHMGYCRAEAKGQGSLDPTREIAVEVSAVLDRVTGYPGSLIWKWPAILPAHFSDSAREVIPGLLRKGLGGILLENRGMAVSLNREFPDLSLFGGKGLNVYNRLAARSMQEFHTITLSPELSGDDIRILSGLHGGSRQPGLEVFVQGPVEAMVSRDCIPAGLAGGRKLCREGAGSFHGILDETGKLFPLHLDPWCRTHVFNAKETCLLDHVPELVNAGISSISIDARFRPAQYGNEILSLYQEAIRRSTGSGSEASFEDLVSRARTISLGGITAAAYRGHGGHSESSIS